MLVALLAKSVQFPLHTWIPEAMNAPTPVSALLHAACYVKAGVYLAARMHSFGPWPASWGMVMMGLGTVTMVVGVVYAMVQHDLKRMLAFHTVSQIGYIITGIRPGHAAGNRRRPAALPEPQPLQGRPVSLGRIRAARHGHPRHEPAWWSGAAHAAHLHVSG